MGGCSIGSDKRPMPAYREPDAGVLMRVLVCGGRSFDDAHLLANYLEHIDQHSIDGITMIIEGGATGADELARVWARQNFIPIQTYKANWEANGKAAGPIRNQRMLDVGKPDVVLAMPGGSGTADMVRRAKNAGVRVIVL